MSEPVDRRTAIAALRDPDAGVIALGPDGAARTAHAPHDVDAALADPEATLMVVSGQGWREYRHLMSDEYRHVEARETAREQPGREQPEREPDGEAEPWAPDDNAEGED